MALVKLVALYLQFSLKKRVFVKYNPDPGVLASGHLAEVQISIIGWRSHAGHDSTCPFSLTLQLLLRTTFVHSAVHCPAFCLLTVWSVSSALYLAILLYPPSVGVSTLVVEMLSVHPVILCRAKRVVRDDGLAYIWICSGI